MKLENRYIWKDFKNEVPELCNALKVMEMEDKEPSTWT